MSRTAALTRDRVADWSGALFAGSVAAALALFAVAAGWRGADLPAQLFRADLIRRSGFVLWNQHWFSGTPTLSYSVLAPVMAAVTGPVALGALSGVVSAVLFDRLARAEFGRAARWGSIWFAVATVTNLIVGRVTFGVGVMFALAALLALRHEHRVLTVSCSLVCGLVSPVAGVFLAITCAAAGWARRPVRYTAWIAGSTAVLPVLVIAELFPSPGSQPYEWWALACDLAICALIAFAVPARLRSVRAAAVVYAAVLIATKLVSNPLGGNVSRLNQYAAGPLLACVLWEHRRRVVMFLVVPLVFWQWFPASDAIFHAGSDPSTRKAYYQPLLDYFAAHPVGFGRVEIAATYRHWEAAFVAPQISLARGWERQLDYAYAKDFYDGTLTAATYRAWLSDNGVKYVALPDTRLDDSSWVEARLLRAGQPYLEHVWSGPHWQLWRFTQYRGLVDGPARLVSLGADHFVLAVSGSAPVTVHVHDSPRWAVNDGGCTVDTAGGWTRIEQMHPGIVDVTQALHGTRCDVDGNAKGAT